MAYIETLPPALEASVRLRSPGPIRVAAATDLTLQGMFGTEWLIITDDALRVYPAAGTEPRLELALASLRAPVAEALIGGGALLATVNGQLLEILRYSNVHRSKFSRIAASLEGMVSGRTVPGAGPAVPGEAEERPRCPRCHLLLPEGTRVCPACLNKGQVILRMLQFIRPYGRAMILVWILMLAGMALSLVPPYLVRPLTDDVLVPSLAGAPAAGRLALLGWLVAGLLTAQTLGQLAAILRSRLLVGIGTRLSHDLRVRVYQHLQFLSLRFFDKRPTGALVSRVIQDTQSLETVLVDGTQYFAVNLLTLAGIGAVLLFLDWRLTLLVLIPVPVVMLLSRLFWRRLRSLWHRYWHYRARLTATVSDALAGQRVIKAFAKEREETGKFRGHSLDLLASDLAAEQTWATLFPLLWLLASTGSVLVWYVGGRQVIGGQMTLGTLMTFVAYLGMFYGPLQFLSRIADYLARALTSAERIFEVLDSEPDVRDADPAIPLPHLRGRVEFRDVTFGYEPHQPVLKRIRLDVQPGEMIGLVGHSGAGKSTLINLICRFYNTSEGEVRVDGVDLRSLRQQDLRAQIGVVLQDTFLFNGTIAENIAYARPEAGPDDILAAAKAANAHDFIVAKSEGYDTRVGERGQSLSGGERQRIAIARAILHDPRILILDEATASVDTDTEQQIQSAIARLVQGRTTFAIAHRLSTLRNADRLIVLKGGEIIEQGTHAELLRRKGEFHRLVRMQQATARVMEVGM